MSSKWKYFVKKYQNFCIASGIVGFLLAPFLWPFFLAILVNTLSLTVPVQFLKKYLEKVGWKLPKAAIWEYLKLLLNLGKKEGIEIATIKEWLIKTEVEDAYDGEGTHGNY